MIENPRNTFEIIGKSPRNPTMEYFRDVVPKVENSDNPLVGPEPKSIPKGSVVQVVESMSGILGNTEEVQGAINTINEMVPP